METREKTDSEESKRHLLMVGNDRVFFSYGRTVTFEGYSYQSWRFDLGVSRDVKPGEDIEEVKSSLILSNIEQVDGIVEDVREYLKSQKDK